MAATPARIGFIQNEFRRAVATTPQVQTRYGTQARESEDPIPTSFDNVADAQVVANARQALLSPERRRFVVEVTGIAEVRALGYVGAVPVGRYTDPERAVDRKVLVSEISIDLGRARASLTLWG